MAKLVSKITLGVDAAKDQHVVYQWQSEQRTTVVNERAAITAWLQSFSEPLRLAIEPTSNYHLTLVEVAVTLGIEVYLVMGRQLAHYRQAVNLRNKTDPQDAYLLARYLEHEADQLRPFRPRDRRAQRLWALLLRRASVVHSRKQLQQSFAEMRLSIQALLSQFQELLRRIDVQILNLIRELGWNADYRRCLSIPGIGPNNAAALVTTYHRGAFSGSDAFVALMGLDVRLRESGRFKGRSRLSKCGEPELRRLLYCASHAARCYHRFADYYQRQLDKGMAKTAARVALARKLARIAFTLMQKQQAFIKQEKTYCPCP